MLQKLRMNSIYVSSNRICNRYTEGVIREYINCLTDFKGCLKRGRPENSSPFDSMILVVQLCQFNTFQRPTKSLQHFLFLFLI